MIQKSHGCGLGISPLAPKSMTVLRNFRLMLAGLTFFVLGLGAIAEVGAVWGALPASASTITASLAGYTAVPKTSAATTIMVVGVFASTPVLTISGTKVSGQTITEVTGTWASGVTFTYVWKRANTRTSVASRVAS
jgi:hypothetical protein